MTSLQPLIERTRKDLKSLGVIADAKLLVAASGGPDSLALAHVLQSLRGTGTFAELTVAHVNHGIRKEAAAAEENALRRYCTEWDVSIEVKRVHTARAAQKEKKGIEETARKERYDFFEELVRAQGFDFVLTAHTANDQAETVLMHLVRGAGVRGLAGIPPKRKLGTAWLVRPWLSVTRTEISDYLAEFYLIPSFDASNEELSYQRNRVRHKVMPVLAEAWPERSPVRTIAGLAERMRELSRFLEQFANDTLEKLRNGGGLSLDGLNALSGFELHTVLEAWIGETRGPFSLTARETTRIEHWLKLPSRRLDLHAGIRLIKVRKILWREKNTESLYFKAVALFSGVPLETPYGEFVLGYTPDRTISKDPFIVHFDEKVLGRFPTIRVRPWRRADRLVPFGLNGKQKLVSDLLTEAHVSGERRKHYPVVEWNDDIIWLPGIRRCDFAKVTDRTSTVLQLTFKPI